MIGQQCIRLIWCKIDEVFLFKQTIQTNGQLYICSEETLFWKRTRYAFETHYNISQFMLAPVNLFKRNCSFDNMERLYSKIIFLLFGNCWQLFRATILEAKCFHNFSFDTKIVFKSLRFILIFFGLFCSHEFFCILL